MAHTLQERYSSLVLAKLRQTSVFTKLFNNRYEGTPKSGAVKIPVRDTEAVVGDYNKKSGGTLNEGTTNYVTLPIDKDKYVNELIDGYEASALPDGLVADRLDSAGYSLARQFDADLQATLIAKGTANGDTVALTKETAFAKVLADIQKLKVLGLSVDEMWLAVSPEAFPAFLTAPEFVRSTQLGDKSVEEGVIGKIAGVKVYEANAIASSTKVEYILGNNIYCHFVDEWKVPVHVAELKDGAHIGASAVQGRRVYGALISNTKTVIVKKHA